MSLLIAIVITASFGLLAWRREEVGVFLLVAGLPTYLIRFEAFGLPFTLLELLALTFVSVVAVKHGRTRWGTLTRKQRLLWQLFFLAGGFGVIVAPDTMAALGLWKAYILEPLLVGGALWLLPHGTKTLLKPLLWGAGITAAVVGAMAGVQYWTGAGIPAPWDAADLRRAVAWYPYPNAIGLFLAPVAVAWLIAGWRGWLTGKPYWLGLSALHAIGIATSVSEGAAAAVIIALLVYVYKFRSRFLAVLISLTLLGIGLLTPAIREVILFQDVSGEVRLVLWQGTIRLLQANPWLGSGLGGFPQLYDAFRAARHTELLLYPHNTLLNFWTQFGIFGPAWLVAAGGWIYLPLWRRSDSTSAILLTGITAMIAYGLVDVPYFKNDLALLTWFFLALALKKETRSQT